MPGDGGGTNWAGAAVDPESGYLYVPSTTYPLVFTLVKPDPNRSNLDFTTAWSKVVPGPQGLPLVKPPYTRVTAIDMNEGDHAWMQPHGNGPKNHPLLKDLGLPPLGNHSKSSRGPLVTKTLLFVNNGGRDLEHGEVSISVYDKTTGEYLGSIPLPAAPKGNPITYMHQGKQYIAVTGGGGATKPELWALSLP